MRTLHFRHLQLVATLATLASVVYASAETDVQTDSFLYELTTGTVDWFKTGVFNASWITAAIPFPSYLAYDNIQGTQQVGTFTRALPEHFTGKDTWTATVKTLSLKCGAITYNQLYLGLVETNGWIASSDFAGVRISDNNSATKVNVVAFLRDGASTSAGNTITLDNNVEYQLDMSYATNTVVTRITSPTFPGSSWTTTVKATGSPSFSWSRIGFGVGGGVTYPMNGFSIGKARDISFTGESRFSGSLMMIAGGLNPSVRSVSLVEPAYFSERQEPLTGNPNVARDGANYRITLNNGCRVFFDPATVTLRAETPEGITILANSAGRILSLSYLPSGTGADVQAIPADVVLTFDRLTLYGEAATFHFLMRSADDKESRLEWTFLPISQTINGKRFDGVGDTLLIDDTNHFLHELTLYGLAATGSDYAGAHAFRLACASENAPGYREATFGGAPCDLGEWGAFIDGGQLFHVVGQKQGTLFEYLDDECHDMTSLGSNASNNAVEITHQLLIGRVPALYCSPMRVRLFTSTPLSMQLWMELARSRRQFFANQYSIPPTPIRPLFTDYDFPTNTSFEAYAEATLPVLQDLGFRRMEINGIDKANLSVLEDIRELVDQAHAMGIEVYARHQMAHGAAEDMTQHLDWLVYNPEGEAVTVEDDTPLVQFDLGSDFFTSTVTHVSDVRTQTNLDGFRLEKYGAGLRNSANYSRLIAAPTVAERMEYMSLMRNMGLGLTAEGISSVAIDSFEISGDFELEGHEPILNATSPFVLNVALFDTLDLFKLLSVQCIPTGPNVVPPGETEADRARLDRIRYRNRCFNLIEDNLGQPLGVVLTSQGSQWVHAGGNALFFYEPTLATIPLPSTDAIVLAVGPNGDIPVTRNGNLATASLPARSLVIVVRSMPYP